MVLYHFLSAQYALEDLHKRRLKLARFDELNDPFELAAARPATESERQVFRTFRNKVAASYGLLCFSRTWQNPVLWSHYADKHRGVCLGFEVAANTVNSVTYTQNRLKLAPDDEPLSPKHLNVDLMRRLLSTKFRDWGYEDEARAIFLLSQVDRDAGLCFCSFDRNTQIQLRSVIIGARCRIPAKTIQSAVELLPGVDVVRARLAFKTFRVVRNRRASENAIA